MVRCYYACNEEIINDFLETYSTYTRKVTYVKTLYTKHEFSILTISSYIEYNINNKVIRIHLKLITGVTINSY